MAILIWISPSLLIRGFGGETPGALQIVVVGFISPYHCISHLCLIYFFSHSNSRAAVCLMQHMAGSYGAALLSHRRLPGATEDATLVTRQDSSSGLRTRQGTGAVEETIDKAVLRQ